MNVELTPLQAKALSRASRLWEGLKPGDAFPSERDLAVAGDVGRTAVRGMMASLERGGFVKRSRYRWIVVKELPEFSASEEGSKRQQAREYLLAELSSGRMRPGSAFSELSVAKEIGVATVSVREALLEMLPLGLLTKKERQRWEVATFSGNRIREMREFREIVEVFSLRKLLAEDFSEDMRASLEESRHEASRLVALQRPATPKMLQADLAFHRLLLKASGNTLLQERAGFIYLIIEFQLVSPFYDIEAGKRGLAQHIQILDAILRRDLSEAELSLIEHIRSAEKVLCTIVQRSA